MATLRGHSDTAALLSMGVDSRRSHAIVHDKSTAAVPPPAVTAPPAAARQGDAVAALRGRQTAAIQRAVGVAQADGGQSESAVLSEALRLTLGHPTAWDDAALQTLLQRRLVSTFPARFCRLVVVYTEHERDCLCALLYLFISTLLV
jgi:hypothetical protein